MPPAGTTKSSARRRAPAPPKPAVVLAVSGSVSSRAHSDHSEPAGRPPMPLSVAVPVLMLQLEKNTGGTAGQLPQVVLFPWYAPAWAVQLAEVRIEQPAKKQHAPVGGCGHWP